MDMSHQLYRRCVQVYPPRDAEEGGSLTRLQRKLRSKLGEDSYPFTFEIPASMPSSVTIQQSARERSAAGKRFGVDHEICVFVGSSEDDKIRKRSSVRLNVRKLAYALKPEERDDSTAGQAVATKGFTFSKGPVTLNVSLEKPLVFHGEPVKIHVKVDNQSRKAVKSVSIKSRCIRFAVSWLSTRARRGGDPPHLPRLHLANSASIGHPEGQRRGLLEVAVHYCCPRIKVCPPLQVARFETCTTNTMANRPLGFCFCSHRHLVLVTALDFQLPLERMHRTRTN